MVFSVAEFNSNSPPHQIMNSSGVGAFAGIHLMAELYGVSEDLLNDDTFLIRELLNAISLSGATLCGLQWKRFDPAGLTIVAMLSESHASVHTYPEKQAMFIDIFTCGGCQPQKTLDSLIGSLKPATCDFSLIKRGCDVA